MGMILALGGEGLLAVPGGKLPCALASAEVLSQAGMPLAVADNGLRQCQTDKGLFAAPPGVAEVLFWQGHPLLLSGEADSLSLYSPEGLPLFTIPAGFAPRQCCLLPGGRTAAIAAGGQGQVLLVRLPDLTALRAYPVPGLAMCLAWHRGALYAACAVGEAEIRCHVCRIHLTSGRVEPLVTLPGLPGALAAAPEGGLYVGATECVYLLDTHPPRLTQRRRGFGLPRRILPSPQGVLVIDPLLEQALLLDVRGREKPRVMHRGEIWDGRLA